MVDVTDSTAEGTLVTEKDAGEGARGVHKFWLLELAAADKREQDYRDNGDAIELRYRAEESFSRKSAAHSNAASTDRLRTEVVSHNILYSNVETTRPALYDSTPVPDIRRRFRDADPMGKQVSEVLERASAYQLEMNDMDGVMESVILDMLLPGRGLARLNYEPTFMTIPEEQVPFDPGVFDAQTGIPDLPEGAQTDGQGNIFTVNPERQVIKDEKVNIVYVPWRNFRISPARTWADVRWICFDWFLTDAQVKKMFPGKDVPLDAQTEESHEQNQEFDKVPSVFKRAYVREVWDKKKKQVVFIAPSFKEGPLRVDDDPLGLEDFFPMPKPIYAISSSSTLVPVAEFFQYASQALELDLVTKRIQGLIKALRHRGVYDATLTEMSKIKDLIDNEFIPITNANQFKDNGGLDKAIWVMPIADAANVLKQLYFQREQIKDTIFEITGLSDILRGVSDSAETATAQNIKSQFGSLRINRRQREVQRYARDIIRLMVEIIAEHFQPETLQKITQKEITPEMMQVMKSDQLRSYRIDIETDSTIARQIQDEEENYTKLLNSIAQFVSGVAPMVAQGFIPIEVAVSLLQSGIRRFKMGRSVEDAFENIDIEAAKQQIAAQSQQGQQDPEAEAKAGELELKTKEVIGKLQLAVDKLELDKQIAASDNQIEKDKLQLEREKANAELNLDRDKTVATLGMEEKKLNAQEEGSKRDFNFKRQVEFQGVEETVMELQDNKIEELVKHFGEVNASQNEVLTQAMQKMTEALTALNQPKKIVKDRQGRPVGVEPVQDI